MRVHTKDCVQRLLQHVEDRLAAQQLGCCGSCPVGIMLGIRLCISLCATFICMCSYLQMFLLLFLLLIIH